MCGWSGLETLPLQEVISSRCVCCVYRWAINQNRQSRKQTSNGISGNRKVNGMIKTSTTTTIASSKRGLMDLWANGKKGFENRLYRAWLNAISFSFRKQVFPRAELRNTRSGDGNWIPSSGSFSGFDRAGVHPPGTHAPRAHPSRRALPAKPSVKSRRRPYRRLRVLLCQRSTARLTCISLLHRVMRPADLFPAHGPHRTRQRRPIVVAMLVVFLPWAGEIDNRSIDWNWRLIEGVLDRDLHRQEK